MFQLVVDLLGQIMRLLYSLTGSYGGCLLLFTVVVKLLFLPLSVWQQKNSIKMVSIQPEINRIRAQYINDSAKAGEEQIALYKRAGYRPLAGLVPTLIQIPLILLVISVVYNPLGYLLRVEPQVIDQLRNALIAAQGTDEIGMAWQLTAIPMIESGTLPAPQSVFSALKGFPRYLMGEDLLKVPSFGGGALIFAAMAILSTVLLCYVQNRANVLQREQTGFNRWGTTALMVGLSVYLAFALPGAVLIYWSAGNLLSILTQFLLNLVFDPRKSIDYLALEESRALLQEALKTKKTAQQKKTESARSKRDYRRFLSVPNKEVVFYSDSSGYYRYYQDLIAEILRTTNDIVIHYLTDDPDDQVLSMESERFKPYYIDSNQMIVLFMKLECTVMVTTVPDLGNYHLKRSIVKPDVEYIYLFHGMASTTLVVRKASFDNYDTLFCAGPHQAEETRETEAIYGLKPKKLFCFGYPLLDGMIRDFGEGEHKNSSSQKQVIIAPSHQSGNILETCLDEIATVLLQKGYRIVLRPHPYWIKHNPSGAEQIAKRYESYGAQFILDTDFGKNDTVFSSDVLITDWSTVALDYAFSTLKPCIFINTEMKVRNPEYTRYAHKPLDITLRNRIGKEIEIEEIKEKIAGITDEFVRCSDQYKKQIAAFRQETIYNLGKSAETGANYIVGRVYEIRKEHI